MPLILTCRDNENPGKKEGSVSHSDRQRLSRENHYLKLLRLLIKQCMKKNPEDPDVEQDHCQCFNFLQSWKSKLQEAFSGTLA